MYTEFEIKTALTILRRLEFAVKKRNQKNHDYLLKISTLGEVEKPECMDEEFLLSGFITLGDPYLYIYASFFSKEKATPLFIFMMGISTCEVVNKMTHKNTKRKGEQGYNLLNHFAAIIGKELRSVSGTDIPEK
jgi:hypothetical protein